jgi:hypothetical protein
VLDLVDMAHSANLATPSVDIGHRITVALGALQVGEGQHVIVLGTLSVAGQARGIRLVVQIVAGLTIQLNSTHSRSTMTDIARQPRLGVGGVREVTDRMINQVSRCAAGSFMAARAVQRVDCSVVTGVALCLTGEGGPTVFFQGSVTVAAFQPR